MDILDELMMIELIRFRVDYFFAIDILYRYSI